MSTANTSDPTWKQATKFRVKRNDVTNMWTTDDDRWQDVIASGCKKAAAEVGLNAVEVWEIENRSGWFHPVHIHLVEDDKDPNDPMTAALPQWDG